MLELDVAVGVTEAVGVLLLLQLVEAVTDDVGDRDAICVCVGLYVTLGVVEGVAEMLAVLDAVADDEGVGT